MTRKGLVDTMYWGTEASKYYWMRRVSSLEQYWYALLVKQMYTFNIVLLILTSTIISIRLYLFFASDRLVATYVNKLQLSEEKAQFYYKQNMVNMITSLLVLICGLYLALAGFHGFGVLAGYSIVCNVVMVLGLVTWIYAAYRVYKYGREVMAQYEYLSYKLRKLRHLRDLQLNESENSMRREMQTLFDN